MKPSTHTPAGVATFTPQKSSYRWVVLLVTWAAYLVSMICRLAWGSIAVSVGSSIGLSLASLGIFVTAFYTGYVLFSVVGGVLTDRFGPRLMLAVSLFGLAAATFAFSFTQSVIFGLCVQAVMGLTAGADYSAAIKLVATWFGTRERGMAIGMFMTATSLAVVIVNVTLPTLVTQFGWRDTYRSLAMVTLAIALVCAAAIKDGDATSAVRPDRASRSAVPGVWLILRDRNFFLLAVAGFGGLWGTVGFASWANALMVKGHHVSLVDAGFVSAIFGVGAIVCKPLIGLLSDWLGGARKPLAIGAFGLFVVMLLIFGQLETLTAFKIAAPILGIGAYIYSPLLIALIAEQGGINVAGSSAGLANAVWQFSGVVAPVCIGVIFQATQSFQVAFLALAAGPLLALGCMMFVREKRAGSPCPAAGVVAAR
ncbi:MFS transporter [Paraburkholderia dipogonis]|uniref:MFS transporter n=1 Tax=Paraburkholderia dipogonis TaxID=1211383 RepID=A0ABW9B5Z2_9BURK